LNLRREISTVGAPHLSTSKSTAEEHQALTSSGASRCRFRRSGGHAAAHSPSAPEIPSAATPEAPEAIARRRRRGGGGLEKEDGTTASVSVASAGHGAGKPLSLSLLCVGGGGGGGGGVRRLSKDRAAANETAGIEVGQSVINHR